MKKIATPETLIAREMYLEKIKPFMGKQLAKVITGQRRVGKSYILFQIIEYLRSIHENPHIIYINKEDIKFDSIKNAHDLNQYLQGETVAGKMNYIFIDEIQEIDEFEKSIRSLLLDEMNDIYLTGSNANLLSGDFATLIAGRTVEIPVYSLTYPEFLLFHKLEDSGETFHKYIQYGGLPYLRNLELTESVALEYLKNIYNTIIYRDVVARNHVRSTVFLEQLIHFLASNVGSLFSAKSISDYLKSRSVKIPPNQVQTFIAYLANAFIIHRIPRYDIRGKRIFESGEKVYFENLGLRNIICGYRPADLGKILENVVLNHFLCKGYQVKVGKLGTNEIDFIGTRNKEILYIQVALQLTNQRTIEREFGNLKKINDNYPKIVVTMDPKFPNTIDGIQHQSIRELLMN